MALKWIHDAYSRLPDVQFWQALLFIATSRSYELNTTTVNIKTS